jgi:hypothetical protein
MSQLIEVSEFQNTGQELVDLWQQSWEINKQLEEGYADTTWLHGIAADQRHAVLRRRRETQRKLSGFVESLIGQQIVVTALSDQPEGQIRQERGTQRDHSLSQHPERLCHKRLDRAAGLVTARSIPTYSENTMELAPLKRSFFAGSLRYCFEVIDPETGEPQVNLELIG